MVYSVKWLESVDSTNNEAIRSFSNCDDFSVFAAKFQTGGKGQRGAKWESEAGKNLIFSFVLRIKNLRANRQFAINQLVTLALKRYLSDKNIDAAIKWPNDIYVGEKKICGILIENFLSGDKLAGSVIGIGLNMNQKEFLSDAPNPISMTNITGIDYSIEEELSNFMAVMIALYNQFVTAEGEISEQLRDMYMDFLYRKELFYNYMDCATKEIFSARIDRIEGDGSLILQRRCGKESSYLFKEVAFLP